MTRTAAWSGLASKSNNSSQRQGASRIVKNREQGEIRRSRIFSKSNTDPMLPVLRMLAFAYEATLAY